METRETLLQCLADKELTQAFIDLEGTPDLKENLTSALRSRAQTLASERMVVSVLGIQGAGKSSLLNALVAGDDLLPVEADETTCIPVELVRSENGELRAQVTFKDGRTEEIAATRNSLDRYVNNVSNPGNEKGVKRIVVSVSSTVLSDGIAFVDLPGVGSLTPANQETTLEYIKECTGAIFLLRTVPPITRLESAFLRVAWPQLSQVIFVQNWWSGETERELQDGKRHNEQVLRQLAQQVHLTANAEVLPVQVKEATRAVYTNDAELRKWSGLDTVLERVRALQVDWRRGVQRDIGAWLLNLCGGVEAYCLKVADDLSKDASQAEEEIRNAQAAFGKESESVQDRFAQLKRKARDRTAAIEDQLHSLVAAKKEQVWSQVKSTISGGVTEGHYLTQVLQEQIDDAQAVIVEDLQYRLQDLVAETLAEFGKALEEITIQGPAFRAHASAEGFKAEKLLPSGLTVLGGVGGPAVLALLVSNPAGWLVGAVGIVGGLIGLFVGSKSQEAVERQRIEQASQQVRSQIDAFFRQLEGAAGDHLRLAMRDLLRQLEQALSAETARTENGLKERLRILEASRRDHERQKKENEAKLALATGWATRLRNLLEKLHAAEAK